SASASCFFLSHSRPPASPPLSPTRRSSDLIEFLAIVGDAAAGPAEREAGAEHARQTNPLANGLGLGQRAGDAALRHSQADFEHRSEEHTSELQSLTNLVCRLLLEKKKQATN